MYDIQYLKLLSESYPSIGSASSELIKLMTEEVIPKGTEYFFSDLHGEHEAFIHQLRSASGVIKTKIDELFFASMTESDRVALSALIYEPKSIIKKKREDADFHEWVKITVSRLLAVCREFAAKSTVEKVRSKAPQAFSGVLDELLYFDGANKSLHFERMINAIEAADAEEEFLCGLCTMILDIAIDRLHIIGDIFDRGPRADLILDELMNFHDIDVQWGNHDIAWMGAYLGNLTCIASVVRIGISYNNFDCLEDGYGINLRPLSMFASEVYADDDCEWFFPHILDESQYDVVSARLAAKMHKAIAIIQFKLEGQLYKRHPEYHMDGRDVLSGINLTDGTVNIGGRVYKLKNTSFPTVDENNPLELTDGESALMFTLASSFMHSDKLNKHMKFLYEKGSMYSVCNGNLLYHGCIPLTEDGEFESVTFDGRVYSGKSYLDYINNRIREAFFMPATVNSRESDFFWYLWCGRKSPLFGKTAMTSFERYFIEDKEAHKEGMNPYYSLIESAPICRKILSEFSLGDASHIINGHVPVKQGENPVKGGGLLFMIDGGISKAYRSKTGICGYTFIYSSRYMAFAKHTSDETKDRYVIPELCEVERFRKRMLVEDTDRGAEIRDKITALSQLLEAYRDGSIKEKV